MKRIFSVYYKSKRTIKERRVLFGEICTEIIVSTGFGCGRCAAGGCGAQVKVLQHIVQTFDATLCLHRTLLGLLQGGLAIAVECLVSCVILNKIH